MKTKEYIEKAIEGGYESGIITIMDLPDLHEGILPKILNSFILDPKAWEAVGSVEGWEQWRCQCGFYYDMQGMIICPDCNKSGAKKSWKQNMQEMIDALIEGKSIEEYLETL